LDGVSILTVIEVIDAFNAAENYNDILEAAEKLKFCHSEQEFLIFQIRSEESRV